MFAYPIRIEKFFVSPEHAYFGQDKKAGPKVVEQSSPREVALVANKGILGDRFFDRAPLYVNETEFDGQVTFISQEVLERASSEFSRVSFETLRRNIVVTGIDLNALIGSTFTIVLGDVRVRFEATKSCSPCRWLDIAGEEGAFQFFRGRGGIRTKVLDSARLEIGSATLETDVANADTDILVPLSKPNLP